MKMFKLVAYISHPVVNILKDIRTRFKYGGVAIYSSLFTEYFVFVITLFYIMLPEQVRH